LLGEWQATRNFPISYHGQWNSIKSKGGYKRAKRLPRSFANNQEMLKPRKITMLFMKSKAIHHISKGGWNKGGYIGCP
jgi:hypothetical protein